MSMHKNVITLCCAAAFALGLAACSSSDDPPPPPPPTPVDTGPTAYEAGKAAVMAARTEADAQAAYDDIDLTMVTGSEAASLMTALNDRVAAIMAASAYARGKAAIMAAMTADDANAAYDDIDQSAITAAQAETLMMALNTRKMEIATADRIDMQKQALMTAAGMIDTSDLSTQALVDAAKAGIVALRQALANAADVSEADKTMYMSTLNDAVDAVDMAQGGIDTDTRRANQMTALSNASTALQTALAALFGTTPTQARLDAANSALAALNAAIMGGGDLTDTEKAPYQREASNAAAPIRMARMAFDDAEDQAEDAGNAAIAALAAEYLDIRNAPNFTGLRNPAEDSFLHGEGGNAGKVRVGVSGVPEGFLSADQNATIAANAGWEGKRYTLSNAQGEYEAVLYSNIEDPTPGKKFGGAAANDEFEYALTNGALAIDTTQTGVPARVGLTGVTRTAGTETFMLPVPNPGGLQYILVPGSFHGVPGTYSCTPASGTTTCTASVATTRGFTLAGGTWTFAPTDPNARVTEMEDADYISYGWWTHRDANRTFRGSVGYQSQGTVPLAAGITALIAEYHQSSRRMSSNVAAQYHPK